MAAVGGFITNDATVAGVTTAYDLAKIITLHEDSAIDARSRALPSAAFIESIEFIVDQTSGTTTTLTFYLTWDSTGDDIAVGPSDTITLVAGLTDTSLLMASVNIDQFRTAPSTQTATGKMYMFAKTDSGTVTVNDVRLNWRTGPRG